MRYTTCTNCGKSLEEGETPCSKCGDPRRTVHLEDVQIVSKATVSLELTIKNTIVEMQRNWPLLVVLIGCNLFSMVPAYFLSGWWSVFVSFSFVLASSIVGYYAITRVVTVTIEKR